jgi:hypothetical protein
MKKIILFVIIVVIAVAAYFALTSNKSNNPSSPSGTAGEEKPEKKLSPLNAKYIVEASIVSLENGKEETIAPYGAEKQTSEVWGTPVVGDLNSDGEDDYALIITQKTANDVGVYYYAAVALADEKNGIIAGSNSVALGDRLDIKDIAIVNNAVRISYLDWKTDGDAVESFPTKPVDKTFILDGIMLKELTEKRANAQAEAACTDNGGAWNKDAAECKGLNKEWCEKNAGKFESDICKF